MRENCARSSHLLSTCADYLYTSSSVNCVFFTTRSRDFGASIITYSQYAYRIYVFLYSYIEYGEPLSVPLKLNHTRAIDCDIIIMYELYFRFPLSSAHYSLSVRDTQ